MRQGAREMVLCTALVAACGDPELTLKAPGPLVVGQEAVVRVTEGGIDLKEASLVVRDSSGRSYGAIDLAARKLKAGEVAFRVPAAIAAGPGGLEVGTDSGPSFTGSVRLVRLITVRDTTGTVWMVAIDGEGKVSELAQLAGQQSGFGSGPLAIGPAGTLLANLSRADKTLRVVVLGAAPRVAPPTPLADLPADAIMTASGETLVATEKGTFVVEKLVSIAVAPKAAESPMLALPTVALARDAAGQKGVALVRDGSPPVYALVRLDLAAAPPSAAAPIPLTWPADLPVPVDVAIGADGAVVAVNRSRDALVLLPAGESTPVDQQMPPQQTGPVAVAAGKGDLFLVVNAGSRNVSPVHVGSKQPIFDPPLDPALPAESGAPVGIDLSARDEIVVLFERDLCFFYGPGRSLAAPKLPSLFADKQAGPAGAAVAVQP